MDATGKAQLIEKRNHLETAVNANRAKHEYFLTLLNSLKEHMKKHESESLEFTSLEKKHQDLEIECWEAWATAEVAQLELDLEINKVPLIDVPTQGVVKGKIVGPNAQRKGA